MKGEKIKLYVGCYRNLAYVLPASAVLHVVQRWDVLSSWYLYYRRSLALLRDVGSTTLRKNNFALF